jgi:hypothetical protein
MLEPLKWQASNLVAVTQEFSSIWDWLCPKRACSIQVVSSTLATVQHPSVFGTIRRDGQKNGFVSSLAASGFGNSASFYTTATGHSPGVIQS